LLFAFRFSFVISSVRFAGGCGKRIYRGVVGVEKKVFYLPRPKLARSVGVESWIRDSVFDFGF
jgi:hypothetical protein